MKRIVDGWCETAASQGIDCWSKSQPVRTSSEDIDTIRYQETTSEDTEDFMCGPVTVIFRVCKSVRLL
jgi:hypothetical protein